jgi:hypothetical protein
MTNRTAQHTRFRSALLITSAIALAACAETSDMTAPASGLSAVSAKGSKVPTSSIPVETVAPGVLSPEYQQLDLGSDAQGRSYWVEEVPTGLDATGEPAGSVVMRVTVLDTATVRTTIQKIRQRTGWVAEAPQLATYDNKAARVTWRNGKLSVTVSVLHAPGRTVQDHGIVK